MVLTTQGHYSWAYLPHSLDQRFLRAEMASLAPVFPVPVTDT